MVGFSFDKNSREGSIIVSILKNFIWTPQYPDIIKLDKHFSPETVERLQQMVWESKKPSRIIETPVYEYAAF